MKTRTSMLPAACGFVLILSAGMALSQSRAGEGGRVAAEEPGAQDWHSMLSPTDHHRRLASLAGDWMQSIVLSGADTPASGAVRYRPVAGGRFLLEEARADLMGMTFEWVGVYGYDTRRGMYFAFWVDNFGTSADRADGRWDEDRRAIVFQGEQDDPRTGGVSPFEWELRLGDPDRIIVEMREPGRDGAMRTAMTITQTRTETPDGR